jgi:multidrug efflux pump subunit AcrA (membrane-fusion protein)
MAILVFASGFLYRGAGGEASKVGVPVRQGTRYHCPMHPAMVADRPGDCPICDMRLVPMEAGATDGTADPPPAAALPHKKVVYRSTMNPNEVSDKPGKDSMGMEMERVDVEEGPSDAARVEGLAAVRINSRKQQLIGVRTEVVKRAPFVRTIRALGLVTTDETRLHQVHTKVGGWIETLNVNTTGEKVSEGQPLLTIYSPELLATQEEYLLALRTRLPAAGAPLLGKSLPDAVARTNALVESGRRRLLLFDLLPAQIEALERAGQATRTVTLHAPISGYVTRRGVTQGEKIDPSTTLLEIADLSHVWVIASIYEYELPFVHLGQSADVTLSYLPGHTYRGRVTLISPVLESATRTVPVRVELSNPDLTLKPDMYAQVEIQGGLGERLGVPESAILSSGTRNVVFVAQGDGYFEPREVRLGLRLQDSVEILDGLAEGESIVTSGNFFVDSESKLKAALEAAAAAPVGTVAH